MRNVIVSLAGASVALAPAYANDQASACIGSLVKDITTVSATSTSAYALSRLVDQQTSTQDKAKVGATIPIDGVPVSLTSDRARRFVGKFYEQTNVNWNDATALAIVSQSLSSNAVSAYRTCIEGEHRSGPRAYAHNATSDHVTIDVRWVAPVGAPKTAQGSIEITGGIPTTKLKTTWESGESSSFIVKRNKGEDIRVSINIGKESVPGGIFVPYVARVRVTPKRETITLPPIGQAPFRLVTDSRGTNFKVERCEAAPPGVEIDHPAANSSVEQMAGPLDETTYVKINRDKSNYAMVCWDALLRPLVSGRGGDMYFRILYPTVTWNFEVLD